MTIRDRHDCLAAPSPLWLSVWIPHLQRAVIAADVLQGGGVREQLEEHVCLGHVLQERREDGVVQHQLLQLQRRIGQGETAHVGAASLQLH